MKPFHSLCPTKKGVSPKQYLKKHGEELNSKPEPKWDNIPQDKFLVCSFKHKKDTLYAVIFTEGHLAYYKSKTTILKYWYLPQEKTLSVTYFYK